jgi:hypothetical protein
MKKIIVRFGKYLRRMLFLSPMLLCAVLSLTFAHMIMVHEELSISEKRESIKMNINRLIDMYESSNESFDTRVIPQGDSLLNWLYNRYQTYQKIFYINRLIAVVEMNDQITGHIAFVTDDSLNIITNVYDENIGVNFDVKVDDKGEMLELKIDKENRDYMINNHIGWVEMYYPFSKERIEGHFRHVSFGQITGLDKSFTNSIDFLNIPLKENGEYIVCVALLKSSASHFPPFIIIIVIIALTTTVALNYYLLFQILAANASPAKKPENG